MVGIYKITSPTGSIYIGQSRDIKDREGRYKSLDCKGQRMLYFSLKKHGFNKHIFELIMELPEDVSQYDLNKEEIKAWKHYKELGFKMLNIKEPGSRGKHSEETLLLMKKSNVRVISDEQKRKVSEAMKGKPKSEETKRKLSQSLKGFVFSQERNEKIRQSNTGKKMPEEQKKKISASNMGKLKKSKYRDPYSPEYIAKQQLLL